MPYVAREDVRTTSRRSLSGHLRLKAWERTGGICVVCDRPIDGVRDRWIVEHIRALELGGEDELSNMGPAHEECARDKTRKDHAATAQAKRRKIRHLGAKVIAHPLQTSRCGMLKRKVDGTVVRRDNPEITHSHSYPVDRLGRDISGRATYQGWNTTAESNDSTEGTEVGMVSPRAKISPKHHDSQVDDGSDAGASNAEILPALPAHLMFMFDESPLLRGESVERFDALQRSIIQELRPQDTIEAIWTKDIIVLIWEAKRLRSWRASILEQADLQAVEKLIEPSLRSLDPHNIVSDDTRNDDSLVAGWVTGSEEETEKVEKFLARRGLTAESVRAHGFLTNLASIERIDRLAHLADKRRDALIRELDGKRTNFARRARPIATEFIEIDSEKTR